MLDNSHFDAMSPAEVYKFSSQAVCSMYFRDVTSRRANLSGIIIMIQVRMMYYIVTHD